jgi:5,5'-dehydrodivanillate O-demethylase
MTEMTAATMKDRLLLLPQTSKNTEMGSLLRRFWHPVARSETLGLGKARPVRVMGEDLTLYRGESGQVHLVGGRCPHRLTLLHTGWIQGENIRCMYHGWQFDAAGRCIDRPAEGDATPSNVRIAGYPVHEYCGLIFAYLGEAPAPAFDLPRKDAFERPNALLFTREETWPCNWLQQVENSLDAVHVSFVHHWGTVGTFGQAVASTIPKLEYEETDAGIRQIATRSQGSRRVSNWTFPNNNHISQPGLKAEDPWIDVGIWMVPVDDTHTTRFVLYSIPSKDAEADERITRYFKDFGDYNPADYHSALFNDKRVPDDTLMQLTSAQDYIAAVGQGPIADRLQEHLGKSDLGIAFLRRIFWRELELQRSGQSTKSWCRLTRDPDMPHQKAEPATASA